MFIDGLASILYPGCRGMCEVRTISNPWRQERPLAGSEPAQARRRRYQGAAKVEVNETKQDGVVVLALKGRLDSNTSGDFEKKLLGIVQQGENQLVLDFSDLDYISSAGLRVLLKAIKELKRSDGQMCVCAVKDYIREIFSLSGFLSFLPTHATLEDSLRTFGTAA
jgi:anti-sigma B factor antagonist